MHCMFLSQSITPPLSLHPGGIDMGFCTTGNTSIFPADSPHLMKARSAARCRFEKKRKVPGFYADIKILSNTRHIDNCYRQWYGLLTKKQAFFAYIRGRRPLKTMKRPVAENILRVAAAECPGMPALHN